MEISAAECIEALRLAGFRVAERTDAATILRRARRVVVVPRAAVLAPPIVHGVLTAAAMSELGFRSLLGDARLKELHRLADADDERA